MHVAAGHQIGVFGVGDDRAVEHGRIFQAGQKQVAAGHVMPVFRYRHRAGQLHVTDLRQFLAFHPLGHRPDYSDPHDAVAAGPFAQTLNQYRAIDRGPGVGHAGHHGKTAGSGSLRAGHNVFLRFQARIAQMHMHVNQAGGDDFSAAVDDFRICRADSATQFDDFPVMNQHICQHIGS